MEVIGNAEAQRRFDSAASHTSVAVDGFAATTPLVHLSEILAGQAGVVAQDRGNYAQDLQIAVRGFGARSTFGVRGVRILVDGIPASMPDGQGQAATAHLPSAAQVDVLRGPLAQLYGNAAGGVVQVTTRDPRPGGAAQAGVALGSYGQRLVDASLDFGDQRLGGLVDLSHFEIDGWRAHSAARRTHFNGKLVARPDGRTRITALLNLYDQPLAQDPLGLNLTQFQSDPRQAVAVATTFDTRKSVGQNQLGVVLDHQLNTADSLQLRAYGGTRQLTQYLSFSGAAANSAGGVVDLDRGYHGVGHGLDARAAHAIGPAPDVDGRPGRQPHVRTPPGVCEPVGGAVATCAATKKTAPPTPTCMRNSTPGFRRAGVRWPGCGPARCAWRWTTASSPPPTPTTAVHAPGATPARWRGWCGAPPTRSTCTPTSAAVLKPPRFPKWPTAAATPAPTLACLPRAADSGRWAPNTRARTNNWTWPGLTPAAAARSCRSKPSTAGRCFKTWTTSAAGAWSWRGGPRSGAWTPRASYTYLDAYFGNPYTGAGGAAIAAGNRLPGTARHTAQLAVDYAPTTRWRVGGTLNLAGAVFANDTNTASAPGYAVAGLNAGYQLGDAAPGSTRWQLWARLDNLFNRRYAGTLIVNDGNGRFFEPAAGRRLMVGVRAQFL